VTAEQIIAECQRLVTRGTKPTLPEVRPLTDAYYKLPGNAAGGELHCVLDDYNYERRFIRSALASAGKPETRWLCHVLLMLSNSQRRRGA
jgi:hypothetical protein